MLAPYLYVKGDMGEQAGNWESIGELAIHINNQMADTIFIWQPNNLSIPPGITRGAFLIGETNPTITNPQKGLVNYGGGNFYADEKIIEKIGKLMLKRPIKRARWRKISNQARIS